MSTAEHTCPKCSRSNFKVWKLPHPLILHWVLNPGLAVNELVLGQRVPRLLLYCQSCDLPLSQRGYIPCPHCGEMADAQLWTGKNAFGNWLGFVCPHCTQRIPCIWNLWSLVVLALTLPLWLLPYLFYYRNRKVRPPALIAFIEQPSRLQIFARMAVVFGLVMWVIMALIPACYRYFNTGHFPSQQLLIGLVVWTLGGLAFAAFMTRFLRAKVNQPKP